MRLDNERIVDFRKRLTPCSHNEPHASLDWLYAWSDTKHRHDPSRSELRLVITVRICASLCFDGVCKGQLELKREWNLLLDQWLFKENEFMYGRQLNEMKVVGGQKNNFNKGTLSASRWRKLFLEMPTHRRDHL